MIDLTTTVSQVDDLQVLKERAVPHSWAIGAAILGEPNKKLSTRLEARWGNKGSLKMDLRPASHGLWYDFEHGHGGDILELIKVKLGLPFQEALDWLSSWLGECGTAIAPAATCIEITSQDSFAEQQHKQQRATQALQVWQEAIPPAGSIVETYLSNRKCWHECLGDGMAIRFHPTCPCRRLLKPAMIGLITDVVTGEPIGIHRTFLLPDGAAKAPEGKMILGNKAGGVIRLKVGNDGITAVAEGIENALTAAHFGPDSVISAVDAGNLGKIPVLPGSKHVAIFSDPKPTEQLAAFRHAARCEINSIGWQVFLPKDDDRDLNDIAVAA